jgi:hypothetical protein
VWARGSGATESSHASYLIGEHAMFEGQVLPCEPPIALRRGICEVTEADELGAALVAGGGVPVQRRRVRPACPAGPGVGELQAGAVSGLRLVLLMIDGQATATTAAGSKRRFVIVCWRTSRGVGLVFAKASGPDHTRMGNRSPARLPPA